MDTGRYFDGSAVHASEGVHEYAAELCRKYLAPGQRILELGSGSGALAKRLKQAGYDVLATDLEPEHEWIQKLDLNDWTDHDLGTFHAIVCVETLEHVENPRLILRQLHEMADPGALLIVSTPNITHAYSRLKFLATGEPYLFGRRHYYSTGHITLLPAWLLVQHCEAAGFRVLTTDAAGSFDSSPGVAGFLKRVLRPLWRVSTRQPWKRRRSLHLHRRARLEQHLETCRSRAPDVSADSGLSGSRLANPATGGLSCASQLFSRI